MSPKVRSAVDYCIVEWDYFYNVTNVSVTTLSEFLDENNIVEAERLPDHSIISWEVDGSVPTYMNKKEQSSKGVHLSINEEYLANKELELEAILEDINSLTHSDQGALDDVYKRLSVLHRDSAQKNIKRRNVKKGRFRARRNQPWWNRELFKMKKEFRKAERVWLQSKNKAKRRTPRGIYILKRKAYSEATRQEKRKFNANREAYIERQLHSNPQKL